MSRAGVVMFAVLLGIAAGAHGDERVRLPVSASFVELSAGPGRGYPVLYAIEQDEVVEVVKRKTDWFKLRTARGNEGWVHRDRMQDAFADAGLAEADIDDLAGSRFEIGVMGGDFGGAASISVYGTMALSPNVAVKASFSQILGNFSDGWIASADVVLQPFERYRIAPYFALGGGLIEVQPQTTLVASQDRRDEHAHATVGARIYISRRFTLRVEYDDYLIFTSRNDNEEVDRWQLGVSAFF